MNPGLRGACFHCCALRGSASTKAFALLVFFYFLYSLAPSLLASLLALSSPLTSISFFFSFAFLFHSFCLSFVSFCGSLFCFGLFLASGYLSFCGSPPRVPHSPWLLRVFLTFSFSHRPLSGGLGSGSPAAVIYSLHPTESGAEPSPRTREQISPRKGFLN